MNINEALEYIGSVCWTGCTPGLDRITELLERIGNPHEKMPCVHIAGTNGKGSTAASLYSILNEAGYKTGLCTSPYIFRFNERMQFCGEEISDDELCEITEFIKPHADAMTQNPTEFELVCAMTFEYFKRKNCDIAIVETGLGGRLDATNIVKSPLCTVIMNIGLDHVNELGDTVEKIALEKAGIIKQNCPTILYSQSQAVHDVIKNVCDEKNSDLTVTDLTKLEVLPHGIEGTEFLYKSNKYLTPLLGEHQAKNAIVVLETIEILRNLGYNIPQEKLLSGLSKTTWAARFEILGKNPWFIVDGGHNSQCAETVVNNMKTYFPDKKAVILTGIMVDKDYDSLIRIVDEIASEYVTITPDYYRALSAEKYAEFIKTYGKTVTVCGENIAHGVETARKLAGEDGVVIAVGSLYLAGPIRDCFGQN